MTIEKMCFKKCYVAFKYSNVVEKRSFESSEVCIRYLPWRGNDMSIIYFMQFSAPFNLSFVFELVRYYKKLAIYNNNTLKASKIKLTSLVCGVLADFMIPSSLSNSSDYCSRKFLIY
jgi:hypothetical protein